MISPGRWHERVPKDSLGNLQFRRGNAARNDPNIRKGLIEACRLDICFYINTFVWQYNPDNIGREVEPFILWDFQEAALRRTIQRLFVEQRRVLWEKSRELGATWLALIMFDWMSLFHDWKSFLCISHTEEAVDKEGKRNTLFYKIRFMHERLPDWITRGVKKRKLSFTYPHTKSVIEGSATTERSGVGGRSTGLLLDEFSKHRKDREILGQTADTGPCLFIGTHYGVGTAFYELTTRPDMFKVVMHWSQHPQKKKGLYRSVDGKVEVLDKSYAFPADYQFVMDGSPLGGPYPGLRSPWYDAECIERGNPRDVAMHLDNNPSGSTHQSWNPMIVRDLIHKHCSVPYWEGDLVYDLDSAEPDALVPRLDGVLKLWLNPDVHGKPPMGVYGVSCDLSHGTGTTPSCLSVGNIETGEKVGELVTPFLDPKQFAVLAVAICNLFQNQYGEPAKLVWEVNGPGTTFRDRVVELGHRNLFKRVSKERVTRQITENIGWYSNLEAKNQLLLEYRLAVYRGRFLNHSRLAMEETLVFQFDEANREFSSAENSPNDLSGAKASHGDRVIADALLWLLMKDEEPQRVLEKPKEIPQNSFAGRRLLREARRREEEFA